MKLTAFNNNPELKPALLACALAHQEADEYLAGTYGPGTGTSGPACSIGCTTRDVNRVIGTALP